MIWQFSNCEMWIGRKLSKNCDIALNTPFMFKIHQIRRPRWGAEALTVIGWYRDLMTPLRILGSDNTFPKTKILVKFFILRYYMPLPKKTPLRQREPPTPSPVLFFPNSSPANKRDDSSGGIDKDNNVLHQTILINLNYLMSINLQHPSKFIYF